MKSIKKWLQMLDDKRAARERTRKEIDIVSSYSLRVVGDDIVLFAGEMAVKKFTAKNTATEIVCALKELKTTSMQYAIQCGK
jgi:hypothetical protein